METDVQTLAFRFEYLDGLRKSGATSMYGAARYLQEDLDLSRDDARSVLSHWMRTFSDEPPLERARKAMGAQQCKLAAPKTR